jgi:excisionase family DNA binding protein
VKKSDRKGPRGADDTHTQGTGRFYSISEVAELVGVVTRTVRRWIEDELLVAYRIGRVLRIAEADLQAFLAAHRD